MSRSAVAVATDGNKMDPAAAEPEKEGYRRCIDCEAKPTLRGKRGEELTWDPGCTGVTGSLNGLGVKVELRGLMTPPVLGANVHLVTLVLGFLFLIPALKHLKGVNLASNFSLGPITFSLSSLGKWIAGPCHSFRSSFPASQNDPEDGQLRKKRREEKKRKKKKENIQACFTCAVL